MNSQFSSIDRVSRDEKRRSYIGKWTIVNSNINSMVKK